MLRIFILLQGVGKDQQSVSDLIVSMKLVDGNGNIRILPEDISATNLSPGETTVSSDDVLKAIQTNLGLFGVILEFTLKVEPMSNCTVNNIFTKRMKVCVLNCIQSKC